MASSRNPSPSPSISSTSTDVTSDLSPEEAEIRNFVKKRLGKRLFLGHYQERRYVDTLRLYRDVVVLHKSETELQVDIERVQLKLISFYRGGKWLGITSPDTIGAPAAGHCLWTKLQDVAFGFYWFQIRQIRFEDNAVEVRLKVIRKVNEEVIAPAAAAPSLSKTISDNVDSLKSRIKTSIHSMNENPSSKKESSSENDNPSSKKESPSKPSQSVPENDCAEKEGSVPVPDKHTITVDDMKVLGQVVIHNWKEIFLFLSTAIVGIVIGLAKCVEYAGNFSLKLLHEFSFLMRTLTPIVLGVIELVGKLVGGLYLLIAMLFRGNGPPPPPQQFRRPQLTMGAQRTPDQFGRELFFKRAGPPGFENRRNRY
ncbi:uncharacterized protein LOC117652328 isoform X2 [Thrips palmi]|nr:uncharacterized protein LOC117652328 isoform X2 [Thrips palmi]